MKPPTPTFRITCDYSRLGLMRVRLRYRLGEMQLEVDVRVLQWVLLVIKYELGKIVEANSGHEVEAGFAAFLNAGDAATVRTIAIP